MNASSADFPRPPLDPDQVLLLRRSFELVEPHGSIAALVFYRTLFTLDPSLKSMFHTSIELQARKLMESLRYTVAGIEAPENLVPVLESMGRRHVSYGVRDEHYETVVTALLEALAETLGREFTPATREAWWKALTFVSDVMKRGSREMQELRYEAHS